MVAPRHRGTNVNVGVVTTSFPLTPDSASGIFVQRLLGHLPNNADITVITPASPTSAVGLHPSTNISVVACRYAPRDLQVLAHRGGGIPAALNRNRWLYLLLPLLLISVFLSCLVRARRFDILHAHWAINGVIAGLAGKLTGTPVLTTLRGSDVNLAAHSRWHRWLLRLCVRWSAKIVAVSETLMLTARDLNPDTLGEKFQVIANGVDDACFAIQRTPTAVASVLQLVTVGNLTANKGVEQILRALSMLSNRRFHLRIVGDGPEKERLIELTSSLGLRQQVEFIGAVAPSRIPDLLAIAHTFLFASHHEGRPNALMEAMAAALPTIASDLPEIREVITPRENGLLFPPGNIAAFAAAIDELAGNSTLRDRLGTAARQSVIDRGLRWENASAQYYRLYQELTGN